MNRAARKKAFSYFMVGAGIVACIGGSLFALRPNVAMGIANRAIEVIGLEALLGGDPLEFDAVSLRRKITPYGNLKAMPYGHEGEVALELSEVPEEIPATLYQSIANWERLEEKMSLSQTVARVPDKHKDHVLVRARIEKPKSKQPKTGWSEPIIVWVGRKQPI